MHTRSHIERFSRTCLQMQTLVSGSISEGEQEDFTSCARSIIRTPFLPNFYPIYFNKTCLLSTVTVLRKPPPDFLAPFSQTSVWATRGVRKEHHGGSGTRVGNARRCPALSTEADSSGKQFRSDCTFPSPWRGLCGLHLVRGWVRGFERWGG